MAVRTRFAPSPTGFLHIGGARTALFSWAYARRHGGSFVLRIEDTDTERSTEVSVNAILDGLSWLGLEWDEGPKHQMQRLARYREVAEQLIAGGHAYRCWMTREELEVLRKEQIQKRQKPRYDGRWRPERARAAGLVAPRDRPPVIRFRTPDSGNLSFTDRIKGPISVANSELDDLVLLRADGVPTYNFGVVVDDLDMDITHVIRGDDHVNNTPRQIHIFHALGARLPEFAHVPMILGADGERLSKRHGATSVMEYRNLGYLPEALANYLARLGWSHGDAEIFSLEQFVSWFDLEHVGKSSARFDLEKLKWLNQRYLKSKPANEISAIAARIDPNFEKLFKEQGERIFPAVELFSARAQTIGEVSAGASEIIQVPNISSDNIDEYVKQDVRPALRTVLKRFESLSSWNKESLGATLKQVVAEHKLKMPQLAIALRVLTTGKTRTPSIEAVLAALGRETVLERLARHLD